MNKENDLVDSIENLSKKIKKVLDKHLKICYNKSVKNKKY